MRTREEEVRPGAPGVDTTTTLGIPGTDLSLAVGAPPKAPATQTEGTMVCSVCKSLCG